MTLLLSQVLRLAALIPAAPAPGPPSDVVPNPAPAAPGVGGASVTELLGIAKWGALICCGAAIVLSGGMIALGNLSQRPHLTERGKTTMVYSALGAVVVAAGIPFIDWMFSNSGS